MIPVITGEFSIVFINYHKTDWIGCHDGTPYFPYRSCDGWPKNYRSKAFSFSERLDGGIRILIVIMLDAVGGDIGICYEDDEEHQHRYGRTNPGDHQGSITILPKIIVRCMGIIHGYGVKNCSSTYPASFCPS